MPEVGGAPAMETQSAFMAASAAVVLVFAVLRARRDRTGLLFAALVASFGAWSGARGAEGLGLPGAPLAASVALVAMGGLAPASAFAFTGGASAARRGFSLLWLAPPVLALAAVGFLVSEAAHPAARHAARGCAATGVLLGSVLLARHGRKPGDPQSPDAVRLRYLAIAHGAVLLGAGVDVVAWQLGWARVAALLIPLLYLYAGYLHLARMRVADLRQLMGNAVALTFLAGGLAAAFAALWLFVGSHLDLFVFNAFVASFLLLFFLEPTRERIQRAMDRRFVAGRIELERMLQPLRERLPHVFTLDDLLGEVLDTVERIGRLRASTVFLREDPHVGFQQVGSVGLPPRRRISLIRSPELVQALESGDALLLDELEKDQGEPKGGDERKLALLRILRQLDAQLLLPLRADSRLLGFWTLSDERTSEPFSSSELAVLRQVASEMAVAIGNSKTFERVRVRDRFASLGEMAAGMAHEFRNPLATIRGALAVIDEPSDEQSREFHDVIVEEIERLDRVMATFLDYTGPVPAPEPIPELGEFVRGCVRGAVRGLESNEVEYLFDIAPDVRAAANSDQLERVISNLVLNAYQALDGKGTVEISVRRGAPDEDLPECAEIVISDDGTGMDEPTLERALVPFFTTKEEGTGLGLALCDRLVRAQGGTLRILSRAGVGTSAVIRLPADVPEETASEDAS